MSDERTPFFAEGIGEGDRRFHSSLIIKEL
jgi:hypothetical protein